MVYVIERGKNRKQRKMIKNEKNSNWSRKKIKASFEKETFLVRGNFHPFLEITDCNAEWIARWVLQ